VACIHKGENNRCNSAENSELRYDVLSFENTGNLGISSDGYCICEDCCCDYEEENHDGG